MKKVLALMLVLTMVMSCAAFPASAEAPSVETLGANIRLESANVPAGIRFGATIDKASAGIDGTYVYSEAADVKFGMYLLPADLLGEAASLADYISAGGEEALDVPAKKIYAQDADTLTYTAVLTDIPEIGYARDILAVPYVVAGGERTFHAELKDSYVEVAKKALESVSNGNPHGITPEQSDALKEIVEKGSPAVLTEQKVALTTGNVSFNRYFVSSGWSGPDSEFDESLIVDGKYDTYSFSTVWGNGAGALNSEAFDAFELIVDLGAAKNLSKINVYAGQKNFGNGWQFATPMNPEILVAGENGAYTSVYTYETAENEDERLDTVTLDPAGNGAAVRYIKYTFTDFNANVTIAEVEVYEMAAGTPGEGGETPEPEEPEEPTLIDRIIVTGEGLEMDTTVGRPLSVIVDGRAGLSTWEGLYDSFYQSLPFATKGDGTTPLFTLTFDLGARYDVTSFSIAREWNGAGILSGSLYGSNDKETWTPLRTGTIQTAWGEAFGGGEYYYTTFTSASYRFFKLDVTELSSASFVKIHEVEFFGTPAKDGGEGPTLGGDGPVFDPNDDSYLDFVPTGDEDMLRIVEWNLLSPEIGASAPQTRFDGVEYLFETYQPDLCGLLECCYQWRDALEDYDYFAENYGLIYNELANYYRATAMSVVAYRKDKFREIDHGGMLFTRDGRSDERGLTWAALEEIESGRKIFVAMTHLAPDGPDEIREIEMEELTEQIAELRQIYNYPLIVLGDFNAYPNDIGMDDFQVNNNVAMTRTAADNIIADGPTCGRWIIDYTFTDKRFFHVLNYSTIDGEPTNVSDHNPSYSDVLWKEYVHPTEE